MATLLELAKIQHVAVRSDGAKFVEGERDDNLDTSWLTVEDGLVTLGPGLYDELLVVKGEVPEDQIKAWVAMGAPFYDPAGNIVFEGTGGRIEIDKHGLKAIRNADGQIVHELDIKTGKARHAGDITGSSGDFADGQVRIGDISGKPWGDGTLPAGTAGIWGEQAGLHLRGYSRLLLARTVEDEEVIDLTDYPNLANPEILIAPKELVSYAPDRDALSHLYVDTVKVPGANKWTVKAKTMIRGGEYPEGGGWPKYNGGTSSWGYIPMGNELVQDKYGVFTNFFICRPWWRKEPTAMTFYARLWMDITDEFLESGHPTNWENIKYFETSRASQGILNWDTPLPHFGQWALRIRGKGASGLGIIAVTGVEKVAYRTDDQYLKVDGSVIGGDDPANTPSGMSAICFAFDRG